MSKVTTGHGFQGASSFKARVGQIIALVVAIARNCAFLIFAFSIENVKTKQFQTVAIHYKSVNVRYICGYMLSHFRNQKTISIWSWTKICISAHIFVAEYA